MTTEVYQPSNFDVHTELGSFLQALYGMHEHFDFFRTEYQRAFDFCCDSSHITFRPFVVKRDDTLVGHAALIVDDRLPAGQAFFGFLEFVDDPTVFAALWSELMRSARAHGVTRLKGPINGSVWHQYRCVSETSPVPFFRTEPVTPTYYYKHLVEQGPVQEIAYSSGIRPAYDALLQHLRAQADAIAAQLAKHGLRLAVETEVSVDLLRAIAGLSGRVFDRTSWGYTELEPTEFAALYDPRRMNEHLYKLILLYRADELVGYASLLREGSDLVCKTIALAPEYQGQGFGTALALSIHEEAERVGLMRIRYVLVRDGNQVHQFPVDDIEIFRRYAAFEFALTL